MADVKEEILRILREREEVYTKELAKILSKSPTTVSKYLVILEAEGRVKRRVQKPYTYWSIKNKNEGEQNG